MALHDIFYIVTTVAMSLITVFLLALVISVIYLRIKLGELVMDVREVLKETKKIITDPHKMASTIGEAVVETTVNQIDKIQKPKRKRIT